MVTLTAPLGFLHQSQKMIHFLKTEAAIGTDRAMARHGSQQLVTLFFKTVRLAELNQVRRHIANQLLGLISLSECGYGPYDD
jgi:hypothetical protein